MVTASPCLPAECVVVPGLHRQVLGEWQVALAETLPMTTTVHVVSVVLVLVATLLISSLP